MLKRKIIYIALGLLTQDYWASAQKPLQQTEGTQTDISVTLESCSEDRGLKRSYEDPNPYDNMSDQRLLEEIKKLNNSIDKRGLYSQEQINGFIDAAIKSNTTTPEEITKAIESATKAFCQSEHVCQMLEKGYSNIKDNKVSQLTALVNLILETRAYTHNTDSNEMANQILLWYEAKSFKDRDYSRCYLWAKFCEQLHLPQGSTKAKRYKYQLENLEKKKNVY